jgi:hypothetical protein
VLGQESVVRAAHEGEIRRPVVSTHPERTAVVVLEAVPLFAPPPPQAHETALATVALTHGSTNGRRDVARGGRRVGLRESLAGTARRAELTGFHPCELLADGCLDDGREVTVRDLRAHEPAKPLELPVKFGAGGELHLVAARREGMEDGRR